MELHITSGRPLRGRTRVPGDKSISHRALLLGALADGVTRVRGWLPATDCQATLRCVQVLGAEVSPLAEPAGIAPASRASSADLLVQGRGLRGLREPTEYLNCGGSGTTARLLAGILAGQSFFSILDGNEQLRRRPMGRVADPLRWMGATILGRESGRLLPLAIQGGDLEGVDYTLPVASAQVKSAVLLAGLYAQASVIVREPGPARDHTERMLTAMGADLTRAGNVVALAPRTSVLMPLDITVPGDPSSAAFLLVAASLVPGSEVVVENVGINPTRAGLLETLEAMGARVEILDQWEAGGEPVGDLRACAGEGLKAVEVAGPLIPRLIDELPILAVAATQASGVTVVRDAEELRVKETDRIATVAGELRKMGAEIEERPDGFAVAGPVRLRGAVVESHNDHRLAMALAVAGLLAEGETVIRGTECIADSFPGFEAVLESLRD
ncbi:MAG: 3-phosphoshikimate 1-carboxyvinyltransferase [Anaerolineae bacterium]|nr:3-phosphoshikimate 1-carboxyvinyltransferase [Anaerolineae bacterium]